MDLVEGLPEDVALFADLLAADLHLVADLHVLPDVGVVIREVAVPDVAGNAADLNVATVAGEADQLALVDLAGGQALEHSCLQLILGLLPGAEQPVAFLIDAHDDEGDPPAHQAHQVGIVAVGVGLVGVDDALLAVLFDAVLLILAQQHSHVALAVGVAGQPADLSLTHGFLLRQHVQALFVDLIALIHNF